MNQLLKKKNELTKKKKGFTLVELIIVIAIIAILAVMAIPKMGSVRESANRRTDLATAKNIATIIATEMAGNNESYAPGASGTVGSDITDKLDGKSTPQLSTVTTKSFSYAISASGDITISYTDGAQVYPEN